MNDGINKGSPCH